MNDTLPDISKPLVREATFQTRAKDGKQTEIDISYGDTFAVWRSDWDAYEVLSMLPDAADLTRINSSGPLLFNHDPDQVVGRVIKSYLDTTTKKLRAVVRAGNSARAKEVWDDINAGVLTSTSFGYSVDKMEPMSDIDGKRAFRVTRFTPVEVSIVAMPASTTVGVSRSLTQPTKPQISQIQMTTENTELKGRAFELAEITAIAKRFESQNPNIRKWADEAIVNGTPLAEFKTRVLTEGFEAKPVESTYTGNVGLSERDQSKYSMLRAIAGFAENKRFDGPEMEASKAAERKYKRAAPTNGIIIPWEVLTQKRDLVAGNATLGGHTVGTNILTTNFVDLLRNKTLVSSYGANTLSGLQGDVIIPKLTGEATAYWLSETAEVPESDAAFGQIGMTPHRVSAYVDLSKQLLIQSSMDCESLIRNILARILGSAFDLAALSGSGVSGEPLGILNTTDIGSLTFGAAATWAKCVEFETTLAEANADSGSIGFLTTPAVRGKWKTTLKDAVAGAGYLWSESNTVNGYRADATKQLTDGKVLFGNWADLNLGIWGSGMELVVDPFTLARQNLVRIIATMHGDVAANRPTSFVASTDSGAQ